jgi:hypothetical protein
MSGNVVQHWVVLPATAEAVLSCSLSFTDMTARGQRDRQAAVGAGARLLTGRNDSPRPNAWMDRPATMHQRMVKSPAEIGALTFERNENDKDTTTFTVV